MPGSLRGDPDKGAAVGTWAYVYVCLFLAEFKDLTSPPYWLSSISASLDSWKICQAPKATRARVLLVSWSLVHVAQPLLAGLKASAMSPVGWLMQMADSGYI